jgi:hypothetical protein
MDKYHDEEADDKCQTKREQRPEIEGVCLQPGYKNIRKHNFSVTMIEHLRKEENLFSGLLIHSSIHGIWVQCCLYRQGRSFNGLSTIQCKVKSLSGWKSLNELLGGLRKNTINRSWKVGQSAHDTSAATLSDGEPYSEH